MHENLCRSLLHTREGNHTRALWNFRFPTIKMIITKVFSMFSVDAAQSLNDHLAVWLRFGPYLVTNTYPLG